MAYQAGVVGASGYGGVELVRLLEAHPDIDLEVVAARSHAGSALAELFPNLAGERVFEAIDPDQLATLDVVFLATPHGPAMELGARLHDAGTRVIDLSAAFRLSADGFSTWYGQPHPRPDLAAGDDRAVRSAVYGLPELSTAADGETPAAGRTTHAARELGGALRDRIRTATLVSNPGCYPTATLLALAPLAGWIVPGSVVVDAKSGTSGAGRGAGDHLHFSHVHGDLVAYGAPSHRHTGEIERWLPADLGPVSFTPHLVPMSRGLLATCYAGLGEHVRADEVQEALHEAYDAEPFIHVLRPGMFPHTKALAGSNGCQLSAVVDDRTGRVTVTSAIDNLGKGAAGQAVQNANLMLGLEEATGLTAIGIYP